MNTGVGEYVIDNKSNNFQTKVRLGLNKLSANNLPLRLNMWPMILQDEKVTMHHPATEPTSPGPSYQKGTPIGIAYSELFPVTSRFSLNFITIPS